MSERNALIVANAMLADSYGAWSAECAAKCSNCPTCSETPCGGCAAGGVCDRMRCTCDDDLDDLDDYDDAPLGFEYDPDLGDER